MKQKFARPNPAAIMDAAPTQDAAPAPAAREVKFTVTLAPDLAARVDACCKARGGVARLAFLRGALLAELERAGF